MSGVGAVNNVADGMGPLRSIQRALIKGRSVGRGHWICFKANRISNTPCTESISIPAQYKLEFQAYVHPLSCSCLLPNFMVARLRPLAQN